MVEMQLLMWCVLFLAANCGAISFIEPCKRDDNDCVLRSARKALPHIVAGDKSLGIEPSDPLVIDHVVADVDELKLRFNNLTITGVKKCDIQKCQRNLETSSVVLEMVCPIESTGFYEALGKLFIVPIEGNGEVYVKCEKVKFFAEGKIKEKIRDGVKYWKIVGRRVDMEPIKVDEIVFKNLYNGNKEEAAPVQAFINNSKNEMMATFGKPILEQVIKILLKKFHKAMNTIPASELELS